jgi:hypothetical protein
MLHAAVTHVGIMTVGDKIIYVSVTLTWYVNTWAVTHNFAAVHSVKSVKCLGV